MPFLLEANSFFLDFLFRGLKNRQLLKRAVLLEANSFFLDFLSRGLKNRQRAMVTRKNSRGVPPQPEKKKGWGYPPPPEKNIYIGGGSDIEAAYIIFLDYCMDKQPRP